MSRLGAFVRSPLGGFTRSRLGARGGVVDHEIFTLSATPTGYGLPVKLFSPPSAANWTLAWEEHQTGDWPPLVPQTQISVFANEFQQFNVGIGDAIAAGLSRTRISIVLDRPYAPVSASISFSLVNLQASAFYDFSIPSTIYDEAFAQIQDIFVVDAKGVNQKDFSGKPVLSSFTLSDINVAPTISVPVQLFAGLIAGDVVEIGLIHEADYNNAKWPYVTIPDPGNPHFYNVPGSGFGSVVGGVVSVEIVT